MSNWIESSALTAVHLLSRLSCSSPQHPHLAFPVLPHQGEHEAPLRAQGGSRIPSRAWTEKGAGLGQGAGKGKRKGKEPCSRCFCCHMERIKGSNKPLSENIPSSARAVWAKVSPQQAQNRYSHQHGFPGLQSQWNREQILPGLPCHFDSQLTQATACG